MNFLEFFAGLAPAGETALIVRQKPVGKVLQYHADGAIKCVWPAFLPTHKIKPGEAWYGNTASFIIDRFIDGKPSAAAAHCEYVLVLVLDDVGTKSKIPSLAPTWIIETSPGNYQYGYVFSIQPGRGEFAAAIRAIAEAGYTDPGACNPVRNFRLPGSVNLKPGRGEFAAVLTEFHPEREFTLEEICAALGVTPGPPDAAGPRPVRVTDDGGDDVFCWLAERGLVLSHPNAQGWAGVICPNAAEHTDGNPEGRYMPATRSYCCLHSHCVDYGSAAFLAWVAEEGGPVHSSGLREELLASIMEPALAKLTPGDLFRPESDAAATIAEVQRRELGRIEKAGWYERFAYIQDDESYFDLIDRREVSRATFNALYRHVSCKSIHNDRKVEASVCFDENRQSKGAPALVGITYAAGETVLCHRDGDVFGNRWRDARQPAGAGDVTPWLDHCAALVPIEAEREHILDVMAHKYQHPNTKINHAVLHGGDEGCGKDTMWAPLLWAVCGPSHRNRGILDNDTLGSQWGYQLEAEIILLNELKEPDARERRALANKLKPIIASPPEMLPINRKGLAPYLMVNRCFVLAFSNDPVPISLATQDRRWFAVWSAAARMDPAAAARLWDWYRAGGFAACTGWLARRDVSRFNPAAAPAMTEFKLNLIEHGMSMAEAYLVELLRTGAGEFAAGVIGSPFHSLCDRLTGGAPGGVKIPQQALLHALKEAGWQDCGRLGAVGLGTKKHIFCAPHLRHLSKSDLRRMVEAPPPGRLPTLAAVK